MSQVSYNGVRLKAVNVDGVDVVPKMSDDGMDHLYTEYTVTVNQVVHRDSVSIDGYDSSGMTAGQLCLLLASRLTEQRRAFSVEVAGQVLISGDGQPDVRNGPFTRSVRVSEVAGLDSFLVRFQIQAYYYGCTAFSRQNSPFNQVLSNRWRESVQIDDNFLSRKTRTGKLVVFGGSRLGEELNPDNFRHLACPPVEQGFHRVSSEYTVQEDGLALLYSFVDQELSVLPPFKALKVEGTWVENVEASGKRQGEYRIRLIGPQAYSQARGAFAGPSRTDPSGDAAGESDFTRLTQSDLVKIGITAAIARLTKAGLLRTGDVDPKLGTSGFVGSLTVSGRLESNDVTVSVKAQLRPQVKVQYGGDVYVSNYLHMNRVDWIPEANAKNLSDLRKPVSVDPGFRSLAGLRLAAAVLNDPCLANTTQTTLGSVEPVQEPQESGEKPNGRTDLLPVPPEQDATSLDPSKAVLFVSSGPLPELDTYLESQQPLEYVAGGVYTHYEIRDTYRTKPNVWMGAPTKSGDKPVFVQFAERTITRVCDWTAERVGEAPALPDPDLGSAWVLLDHQVQPVSPEYAGPDSAVRYRVSGTYTYGATDPTGVTFQASVSPQQADLETGADDLTSTAIAGVIGGARSAIAQAAATAATNFKKGIISPGYPVPPGTQFVGV